MAVRVIQVVNNLLGNALKFSPSGSTLRLSLSHQKTLPPGVPGGWAVRVSSAPHPAGFAVLSLADRGPGVPAEEKTKIFEKFHQVRRDGKRPGQGTGLGLAISRTIVEAHAGALWVQDNPEGGSIFCLLLPAEAAVLKKRRGPRRPSNASCPDLRYSRHRRSTGSAARDMRIGK